MWICRWTIHKWTVANISMLNNQRVNQGLLRVSRGHLILVRKGSWKNSITWIKHVKHWKPSGSATNDETTYFWGFTSVFKHGGFPVHDVTTWQITKGLMCPLHRIVPIGDENTESPNKPINNLPLTVEKKTRFSGSVLIWVIVLYLLRVSIICVHSELAIFRAYVNLLGGMATSYECSASVVHHEIRVWKPHLTES